MYRISTTVFLAFWMFGCQPIQTPKAIEPNALVVVKDISTSNSFDETKLSAYLNKKIEQHIKHGGDRIVVLLAGNSGYDLSGTKVFKLALPVYDLENVSELEVLKRQKELEQAQTKALKELNDKVLTAMRVLSVDEETHLLETLPHLDRLLGSLDSFNVSVVYFSDMVEDSDLRSFYSERLNSVQDLTEMATKDANALDVTYEMTNQLSRINSVLIVCPNCFTHAVNPPDHGFIIQYWQSVFAEFGVNNVSLENSCL